MSIHPWAASTSSGLNDSRERRYSKVCTASGDGTEDDDDDELLLPTPVLDAAPADAERAGPAGCEGVWEEEKVDDEDEEEYEDAAEVVKWPAAAPEAPAPGATPPSPGKAA